MSLPGFIRRILGPARFPQSVGQGTLDPVKVGKPTETKVNLDSRLKSLGIKRKRLTAEVPKPIR